MVIVARMYGATQSAGLDVVVNDDDVEAWHVLIEVFDPWSLSSDARLIRKRSRADLPYPVGSQGLEGG